MPRANIRWVLLLLPALAVIAAAQRITTSASVLERPAGGSIDLPCNVEGLNKSRNVVSWKKGDMLLTKGKLMFTQDPRLAMHVNGTNHILTISSLKGADSADYHCVLAGETTGPFAVVHRLNVLELPSAMIESAPDTLTSYGHREVPLGGDVFVRCHVYGHPPPRTRWYRLGGGPLPMEYSFTGTLWIRNAALNDSGIYECQALTDDASGSAQVEIVVKEDAATTITTSADVSRAICQGHAECGENAQCVYSSQVGDYSCQCVQPYVGDGIECSREAQAEPATCETELGCHEFAKCVVNSEQRICQCVDGYMGDGFNCVSSRPLPHGTSADQQPATTAAVLQPTERRRCHDQLDCHVLAHCVLDESSLYSAFYCRCLPSHHGDGVNECLRVEECDPRQVGSCDPNESCLYNHDAHLYACQRTPVTSINIEGSKKSAGHPNQLDAPIVAIRTETSGECECGSADENLETKLRMTKITIHLTRNQKLEFISYNEFHAFKMRNPEYFD